MKSKTTTATRRRKKACIMEESANALSLAGALLTTKADSCTEFSEVLSRLRDVENKCRHTASSCAGMGRQVTVDAVDCVLRTGIVAAMTAVDRIEHVLGALREQNADDSRIGILLAEARAAHTALSFLQADAKEVLKEETKKK